jgi:hypothetical protein
MSPIFNVPISVPELAAISPLRMNPEAFSMFSIGIFASVNIVRTAVQTVSNGAVTVTTCGVGGRGAGAV